MLYAYAAKNGRRYPYYLCKNAQKNGWIPGPGYLDDATGFRTVRAFGSSGHDRAYLMAGPGTNSFTGSGNTGTLSDGTDSIMISALAEVWLDDATVLPAGTSGLVKLTYQPDRPYRAAVFAGLAMLALIMLIAAWPSRWWWRRRRPPAPPRRA